jgi:hypothetical protein
MTAIPGLPPISSTALPAAIRTGSQKDQQTYKTAMGFEQMLVGQLVQSMVGGDAGAATTSDDSGDDGASDVSNPMASGPYASQLQDSLTSALEGSGGLGLAQQLYKGMQAK